MRDLIILLEDGFEEIEALTINDYLRRAKIEVDLVSVKNVKEVESSHGVKVVADYTLDEVKIDGYKGIYIPGGQPGSTNLSNNRRVKELVSMYDSSDKYVVIICAGPMVLDAAGVLKDKKFTCYPGVENRLVNKDRIDEIVVEDENIITAMGPSTAQILAFKLISLFKDDETSEKIKKDVLFYELEREIRKND